MIHVCLLQINKADKQGLLEETRAIDEMAQREEMMDNGLKLAGSETSLCRAAQAMLLCLLLSADTTSRR